MEEKIVTFFSRYKNRLWTKGETSNNYLHLISAQLEKIIDERINSNSSQSYTNDLFKKGINKVAQKVGEEAIELIIEAKDNNIDLFLNEACDFLYHYLILLKSKNISLDDVSLYCVKEIMVNKRTNDFSESMVPARHKSNRDFTVQAGTLIRISW